MFPVLQNSLWSCHLSVFLSCYSSAHYFSSSSCLTSDVLKSPASSYIQSFLPYNILRQEPPSITSAQCLLSYFLLHSFLLKVSLFHCRPLWSLLFLVSDVERNRVSSLYLVPFLLSMALLSATCSSWGKAKPWGKTNIISLS